MKLNLSIISVITLCLITVFSILPPRTQAANLTQAMVRLDRLASNTSLSGLICATPSAAGAGTEGQVKVTFPADFSISTTASNWTTGTSGLPSGSTPWPGISASAQSVSGNTVTYTGSDLNSGAANYCFTFTGASSTTGSSGAKAGTITTATSGGSTIDTRSYALTVTNDRIGVSATVAAQPDDFTATLTRLTSGSLFGQDDDIEYELSYSSLLAYATTSISVEASWSLGTVEGSGVPTVDLLDYVSGSATDAYNSTPPVIDPVNRNITWTIGTFPASTSGTVRFKLRTNDEYQGSSDVTFDVSGRTLGPGTATSYSTDTSTYRYNFSGPTGTPGPTSTPGPGTPTPTGTPTQRFSLQDIELRSISSSTVQVDVTLSHAGTIRAFYGLTPRNLSQSISTINRGRFQTLTFSGLAENTPYFFRFTATDAAGRQITSDIYTFTTAKPSEPLKITPDTFIATSEKTLLFTFLDRTRSGGNNFIVLPPGTIFETQFAYDDESSVKNSLLLVRNKNVLGINSFTQEVEAATNGVPMLEIKPGVFTGRLQSNDTPGYYELFTRVSDYNGNVTEEKLADLKVSKPFKIYREDNHDPVERARIFLSLYNSKDRTYIPISPQAISIRNPVYSDPDGTVPVVLPAGSYRAEIEGLGFEKKTVDFTLGVNPSEDYPTVALKKRPFNLLYGAQYLLLTVSDLGNSLSSFALELGTSRQMLNLIGFIIITSFILLTLIALSHRTHVRISHMPRYFLTLLHLASQDANPSHDYTGKIRDGRTKEALADVDVFVSDVETGKVVFHTKSNRAGKFHINLPSKYVYLLNIEKIGYHSASVHLHHLNKGEEQQFALLETEEQMTIVEGIIRLIHSFLDLSFELLLLLSIVATVLLAYTIGFLPVLPFLGLAIFNLVFWGLHMIHQRT